MTKKRSLLGAICLFLSINSEAFATYTLIYTGNLNGELEPCGCTLEGDFGGIKRQVTVVDQLRQQDPGLLLVSSGGLLISEIPSDRIRSDYILHGMKLLGYDAIGVQARDLAYGTEFLTRHGLPLLLGSRENSPEFASKRTLQRKGSDDRSQRFSFFHWSDLPAQLMMKDPSAASDADKEPALARLAQELASEKRAGAITVVTTSLRPKTAKQVLPLKDLDILIIPSRRNEFSGPEEVGDTLLLQPGARGMRIGVLQFETEKRGDEFRIVDWKQEIVPLPKTIPDSPRTEQWYADYDAALKADYERHVVLREGTEKDKSPFAGVEKCQACHLPEFTQWRSTQHALAYEDLEALGKNFDPNCVGCHSVGFNMPGGFLDMELTPHLRSVQCESCHGEAQAHVDSGGKLPTGNRGWDKARICAQCHIGGHSPSFDMESYWPKVQHRGVAGSHPDPQRSGSNP